MTNYTRSLRLLALDGRNLAEILMPEKIEDDPVILMPTAGMYAEQQIDHTQPHVRSGPHRMHAQSFLTYLAAVASAAPPVPRLAMRLEGESPERSYCGINLARTMQADDLAEITGLPVEKVRHFLASHLTFEAVSDESG